jgi:hypothetical protein
MAGGVAVFDYNRDGRPDIFFANGANIATLKKDDPKYRNRLFRNDGNGKFTDVTEAAGLAGTGYDIGVAIADYDNDGHPDIFVAGLYRNTLYHNNGNGTFTDVTAKAGLDRTNDPEYGPLWSVGAVWVDVNNDGLLDLFVVNYMQWQYRDTPLCTYQGTPDYCHPRYYKGQPNSLYLNNGDGTFRDVSEKWGIRKHVGKGMGGAMADYDLDGRPDIFAVSQPRRQVRGSSHDGRRGAAGRRKFHLRHGGGFSRREQRRVPRHLGGRVERPDISAVLECARRYLPGGDRGERVAQPDAAHGGLRARSVRFR